MGSINSATQFIYGNQTSEEFGVFLASGLGSVERSSSVESRSIMTTKNVFNNLFNIHNVGYSEPLSFDIIIVNLDGSYIDCYKERELKKWLMKNKRQWFSVSQDDQMDTNYYCIATSCEIINVGFLSGGMKINFSCDSPWAWSDLKKKSYISTGTLTFNFNSVVDFDEYITYPQLTISPTVNGTISIKNNTSNETVTISNCVTSESIILDCRNDKISSTSGAVMLDRWSKTTIGFVEGLNSIELTGNFKLDIQYRLPIRVGG